MKLLALGIPLGYGVGAFLYVASSPSANDGTLPWILVSVFAMGLWFERLEAGDLRRKADRLEAVSREAFDRGWDAAWRSAYSAAAESVKKQASEQGITVNFLKDGPKPGRGERPS